MNEALLIVLGVPALGLLLALLLADNFERAPVEVKFAA